MYLKQLLTVLLVIVSADIRANIIPYKEDIYTQQAPQEIENLAKEAADLMEFKDGFEVVVPKKAGIEINPWNKFVSSAKNQATQNPFILVNPEWFSGIPHDQQIFLLARCFALFQENSLTTFLWINIFFVLLSILLLIFMYWLLGKSPLLSKKWMRALCALGITIVVELSILDNIRAHVTTYLGSRIDMNVIQKVVAKTGNKDAAIKALQYFDTSLKEAVQNGETILAPFKNNFEKYVDELRNISRI